MTDVEKVLKEDSSAVVLAKLITGTALRKKLEEVGSITVNMDAVVDDKELAVIEQAVVCAGAVGLVQEAHIKDKKEQEQKTLESNVGSHTSSLYNPNSSYSNPGCAEDPDGGYKLEL